MRLPRFALALTCVLMWASACSSPAADVTTAPPAPAPATSSVEQPSLLPLPEASLGAQGTDRVQVELYLKSAADVAEQVDATVAFRVNGKEFTRATISQALQPGEAITVVVTPKFAGDVPMGYTSAIVALRASDRVVIASAPAPAPAPEPDPEPSTGAPIEPSAEAVPPSDEAAAQEGTAGEPTGEQIESSGDYVCRAGIDALPNLTRGSSQQ